MEVPFFFSFTWWLKYLLAAYQQDPGHVLIEITCIAIILYLFFSKSYDPKKLKPLSKAEEDALINEWKPEPLCPPLSEDYEGIEDFLVCDNATGSHAMVEGRSVLNLASFNFLGLADCEEVKAVSKETIEKYGVGSCGPRGFYGSIDVHLNFEKAMADFMGYEDSLLYSDGVACVSSVIPAFSKRGDLIICDEGIQYGALQGISLSRSNVLFFKHNDMEDLELTLKNVLEKDLRRPKKQVTRRFIVVEGIFQNHGDIAHLDQIVALKKKYKYRLILDDSYAFGVLGKTGRGTPEHFNVPVSDVDLYCVTADCALATTGGFCMGSSSQVVDHQRLSGAGYVYSAASPPFCSTAGICNLGIIEKKPELCAELRRKSKFFRKALSKMDGMEILGDDISPVIHLRLLRSLGSRLADSKFMRGAQKMAFTSGVIVEVPVSIPAEKQPAAPSVRLLVTVMHKDSDLEEAAKTLAKVFGNALANATYH